jgi:2,5-diamino-6-(ribosylamino)-4(3H)-pyrimidinone 5'-phosphate reductase
MKQFHPDAIIVGSITALSGMEEFMSRIPKERQVDFRRPKDNGQPLWVIPDSSGRLMGKLHALRQSGYCSDVCILLSQNTKGSYEEYLQDREYSHYKCGISKVNLKRGIEWVTKVKKIKTFVVDSGPNLTGLMLSQGLIDQISLIITPVLAGNREGRMFSEIVKGINLTLIQEKKLKGGVLHLQYSV